MLGERRSNLRLPLGVNNTNILIMNTWTFFNDEFIPEEKTFLHVSDLSIQRAYGVFDFFKIINSQPVFLEEHLQRFYFSAEQMHLPVRQSKDELKKIIFEFIKKNAVNNTGVRITLTGGYSADGYQLGEPNLVIALRPFTPLTAEEFHKGIKIVTYEHQRQLPHVKTIDYIMGVWLQPLLKEKNADDVLYHLNGIVTETPRSNIFIITDDDRIVTPAKNMLKGITRNKLIEIAKTKFFVEERDISVAEIKKAQEAFITSTTKVIFPIRQIDDYILPIDNRVSVQLFEMMQNLFHA